MIGVMQCYMDAVSRRVVVQGVVGHGHGASVSQCTTFYCFYYVPIIVSMSIIQRTNCDKKLAQLLCHGTLFLTIILVLGQVGRMVVGRLFNTSLSRRVLESPAATAMTSLFQYRRQVIFVGTKLHIIVEQRLLSDITGTSPVPRSISTTTGSRDHSADEYALKSLG